MLNRKGVNGVTDTEYLHVLLKTLCHIRLRRDSRAGICNNVFKYVCNGLRYDCEFFEVIEEILEGIFQQWPKYSGCWNYPVPSVVSYWSPRDMFGETFDMWEGEYGKLRMELLDFSIDSLKLALKTK